jgi:hypothetical protein
MYENCSLVLDFCPVAVFCPALVTARHRLALILVDRSGHELAALDVGLSTLLDINELMPANVIHVHR